MGVTAIAVLWGAALAWRHHPAALAHYDARAHLVVARRVIDSITPGWEQIGGVWLPLPHLLNLVPVQLDVLYRTGASAILVSIVSFSLAVYALARAVSAATGSTLAAVAGAVVLLLNPNLLYLQATPMTESLLIGLVLLATWLTYEWVEGRRPVWQAAIAVALACLTRYEAWPVTALLLGLAWYAQRRGRGVFALAAWPVAAVGWFLVHSRLSTGAWFVSGFYVPDNPVTGRPLATVVQVWWGAHELSGYGVTIAGLLGAAALLAVALVRSRLRALALFVAPLACAAVPWLAFFQGHPFRIRYMAPVVAANALTAALAVGLLPAAARRVAAGALIILAMVELRPFDPTAPMVVEAQWDRANTIARRAVTACLREGRREDEKIMASMGSLAHYMHDTAAAGFSIRDFLHEGNGDIWESALVDPRPHAGWVLIEEQAEGGDLLARRARENPRFLEGFTRVCEGGGVALYRNDGPR